jgi:hypothetical protein
MLAPQPLCIAKAHCEGERFDDAERALGVTWDSLLDDMAEFGWDKPQPSTVPIEILTMSLCLRSFLDRVRGLNSRRTSAAMLGRVRSYLEPRSTSNQNLAQLLCVVQANLADDLRRAESYKEADELFYAARAHLPPTSPTGGVAAMMQGLLWLEQGNWQRAEQPLVDAGRVIICRETQVARTTHALLASVLVYICRNDLSAMYAVLDLPESTPPPPTYAGAVTVFNQRMVTGQALGELLRNYYVPLCAPLG